MPTPRRPSRFRLPADVRPTEYDLHLVPDLAAGRFAGTVRITVALERARREIVLHAADLAVGRAGGEELAARPRLDRDDETVTLRFARPLPAGEVVLELAWTAKLNEHLR